MKARNKPKKTITFRLDAEKLEALDSIADGLERDRSWVLGEAVESYLEIQRWHVEHIKEGLKQADEGRFAKEADVAKVFAKWRK
jgi:predicted transcriptional regulator